MQLLQLPVGPRATALHAAARRAWGCMAVMAFRRWGRVRFRVLWGVIRRGEVHGAASGLQLPELPRANGSTGDLCAEAWVLGQCVCVVINLLPLLEVSRLVCRPAARRCWSTCCRRARA